MKKTSIRVFISLCMLLFLLAALTGSIPKKAQPMRKNLTALEVTKLMGNGINLGNTMEASNRYDNPANMKADASHYETLWGEPVTTKAMIAGMKKAGFDSLRIPVAWTNMMDYESGDYTISKKYLDRVEEIVNYAIDSHMYVVINDHWDGGWWAMFGSADKAKRAKAMAMYKSMWTQISKRFKNYSDYLIFEGANEEIGNRLNDAQKGTKIGTLSKIDLYKTANKINQTFVNTVRATGGNNKLRFLLIPGYDTSIPLTCDKKYVMPKDSAKKKLIVSVHYYSPFGYSLGKSLGKWGTVKDFKDMNAELEKMTKFTKKGYGVIIGECGVERTKKGKIKDNTVDYLNNLLNNCDKYNYCPMAWDISAKDAFQTFNRRTLKVEEASVAKLYLSRNVKAQSKMTDKQIVKKATDAMSAALVKAKDFVQEKPKFSADGKAVAWIMYSSADWGVKYSVGDIYTPTDKSTGLIVKDAYVKGKGTYTVSLDFTGTDAGYANSVSFSALGIANGEILYPGYVATIDSIKVNGEEYKLTAKPYTTSDDKKCTRVNLYNAWVTDVKSVEIVRTENGSTKGISPCIIDPATIGDKIKTISVTFTYKPNKCYISKAVSGKTNLTVKGTTISASVSNKTKSLPLKLTVNKGETWKLYSDKACKKVISSKKMTLSVGTNTAYVKVTSADKKVTKVYTVKIKRKK